MAGIFTNLLKSFQQNRNQADKAEQEVRSVQQGVRPPSFSSPAAFAGSLIKQPQFRKQVGSTINQGARGVFDFIKRNPSPASVLFKPFSQKAKPDAFRFQVGEGLQGPQIQQAQQTVRKPVNLKRESSAEFISALPARVPGFAGRQVISAAKSATGSNTPFIPQSRTEQLFFGQDPIKPLDQRLQESVDKGTEVTGSPLAGSVVGPVAVAGGTILDTAFGGKGSAVKKIAKSQNVDEIAELLAPILKSTKKEVRPLANQLKNVDDTKKITKQIQVAKLQPIERIQTKIPDESKGFRTFDTVDKRNQTQLPTEQVQANNLHTPESLDRTQTLASQKTQSQLTYGSNPIQTSPHSVRDLDSYNEVLTTQPKSGQEASQLFKQYEDLVDQQQYYLPAPKSAKVSNKGVETKIVGDDFVIENFDTARVGNKAKAKKLLREENRIESNRELFDVINNTDELKDISTTSRQFRDVFRNFDTVFGKKAPVVKKAILDPFDDAKGAFINNQESLLKELDEVIVSGLGIKKRSKESAAVQQFGEGLRDLDSIVKEFGEERAQDIVAADEFFRAKYDQLLDDVNAIRRQIYPNNPDKQIPKRKNYYRHFTEMREGLRGLQNIFETPSQISPHLEGISPFTKPKSKFLSFAQKRLTGKTDYDAVGGFLEYVPTYSYAKHIDPQIGNFRKLADDLANATDGKTKGVNNFINFLRKFANDLSGKTHDIDRSIADMIPGGRKAIKLLSLINNRIKANLILGNVSSMIAQAYNIPQSIGNVGPAYSAMGAKSTMAQIFTETTPIAKSRFIKERYADSMYNKFDTRKMKKVKNFVAWMTGAMDEIGTKYIWNSHYHKAIAEKIDDPIRYADNETRRMVAGRGVGEVPIALKAETMRILAPFQIEVVNLIHVYHDFAKEGKKGASKIATTVVASYLMNEVARQVRGSDVTFDPINATIEGIEAYKDEPDQRKAFAKLGGRLTGEVLSNVPFGTSVAANFVPQYGASKGPFKGVSRADLFGEGDPTRFGTGLLLSNAKNPLFNLAPGFGGSQLKKTYKGVKSVAKGKSETGKGKTRFNVKKTIPNVLQATLFGEFGTKEGRKYLKEGRSAGNADTATARQIFDDISKYKDRKDRLKVYDDYAGQGLITDEVDKKLGDLLDDEKSGITKAEKKVRNKPVAERADYVYDKLSKAKDRSERLKLYDDFVEKKIITDSVDEALGVLIDERPFK